MRTRALLPVATLAFAACAEPGRTLTAPGAADFGRNASGGHPHFIRSATDAAVKDLSLVVHFKEGDLSAGSIETITLAAIATASYECWNRGGNHPEAANKATISEDVSGSRNVPADENGNLVSDISIGPPGSGSFSCPNGQELVGPTNVSYTHVLLTDQTSDAIMSLGDLP